MFAFHTYATPHPARLSKSMQTKSCFSFTPTLHFALPSRRRLSCTQVNDRKKFHISAALHCKYTRHIPTFERPQQSEKIARTVVSIRIKNFTISGPGNEKRALKGKTCYLIYSSLVSVMRSAPRLPTGSRKTRLGHTCEFAPRNSASKGRALFRRPNGIHFPATIFI